MKKFYTSDLHFKHHKLYETGFRPFKHAEACEEKILHNFNRTITKQDHLWILGDLTINAPYDELAEYLSKFNGTKFVIHGNHDKSLTLNRLKEDGIIANWHYSKGTHDVDEETKVSVPIYMNHMPLLDWHTGSLRLHLHGHMHGVLKTHDTCPLRYDVGVDAWDYKPFRLSNSLRTRLSELIKFGCRAPNCMLEDYCEKEFKKFKEGLK